MDMRSHTARVADLSHWSALSWPSYHAWPRSSSALLCSCSRRPQVTSCDSAYSVASSAF